MAGEIVELATEERRRRWTLIALGSALFVSTVPVRNERALFSPLGDIPILGNLSPVAYAVTFGYGPGPQGGRSTPGRAGGGNRPPVAFAARIPPAFATPPGAATNGGTPSTSPFTPTTAQVLGPPGVSPPLITRPPSGGPPSSGGLPPGAPPTTGGLPPAPNPTPPVPEPATWVTLLFGFGVIGALMRRSRRLQSRVANQVSLNECSTGLR